MAGLAGFDDKGARALEHGFHLLDGKNPAGELGEIAVMEKIRQQSTVAGEERVGRVEQIVEELFRRPSCRPDLESVLDVLAHDLRDSDGEFAGIFRLHQRAGLLQPVERDFIRQLRRGESATTIPAPSGVTERR